MGRKFEIPTPKGPHLLLGDAMLEVVNGRLFYHAPECWIAIEPDQLKETLRKWAFVDAYNMRDKMEDIIFQEGCSEDAAKRIVTEVLGLTLEEEE